MEPQVGVDLFMKQVGVDLFMKRRVVRSESRG